MFKILAGFIICLVVMTCDMFFLAEHLFGKPAFASMGFEPLVILNLFWILLWTCPDKIPKERQ